MARRSTRTATEEAPKSRRKYDSDKEAADRLTEAVQDLPDAYLMCRDVRHAWEVTEDFHVAKSTGSKVKEIKRVLTCPRCGCERHEKYHLSRWGLDKVGQNYSHPDGYVIHGVPRGVKPSFIVQGEQYRRVLEKVAASEAKVTKLKPKKSA